MKIYEYISPVLSKIKELYSNLILNDTSNFNNNLSSNDDTVQKALDTLDDLSIPADVSDLTDTNGALGKVKVDAADTSDYLENQLTGATDYQSIGIVKISRSLYLYRKFNTLIVTETGNNRVLNNARYDFALINPSNQNVNVVSGETTQAGRTVFIINTGTTYNLNVYGTVIEPSQSGYFVYNNDGTMTLIVKLDNNGNVVNIDTSLDTSNFNNNLSSADDTIQKAFDTLDDLATGSLPTGTENQTLRHDGNDWVADSKLLIYDLLNMGTAYQVKFGQSVAEPLWQFALKSTIPMNGFQIKGIVDTPNNGWKALYITASGNVDVFKVLAEKGKIYSKNWENKTNQDAIIDGNEYLSAEIRNINKVFVNVGVGNDIYQSDININVNETIDFDLNAWYTFEMKFYLKAVSSSNFKLSITAPNSEFQNVTVDDTHILYNLDGTGANISLGTTYDAYIVKGLVKFTSGGQITNILMNNQNSASMDLRNYAYFKAIKETQ